MEGPESGGEGVPVEGHGRTASTSVAYNIILLLNNFCGRLYENRQDK